MGTLTGAILMIKKIWKGAGVFHMEQLDPDPYMDNIGKYGLLWTTVVW